MKNKSLRPIANQINDKEPNKKKKKLRDQNVRILGTKKTRKRNTV
jgi:hypothetical protein